MLPCEPVSLYTVGSAFRPERHVLHPFQLRATKGALPLQQQAQGFALRMPSYSLLLSSTWASRASFWRWLPASAAQRTPAMPYLDCFPARVPSVCEQSQASLARPAPSDARLRPLQQHEASLASAPAAMVRATQFKGSRPGSVALLSSSTIATPAPGYTGFPERSSRLSPPTQCLLRGDATVCCVSDHASPRTIPLQKAWEPRRTELQAAGLRGRNHRDWRGILTQAAKGQGESASAAATAQPRAEGEEPAAAPAVVDYLSLTDAELLRQCNVDTYRASGPGGQHRNKTESAVRLRHTPTGCLSQSAEQRSQHLNRDTALLRLRQAIALKVRRPVDLATYQASVDVLRILPSSAKQRLPRGVQSVGPKHQDFHAGVRELLDVLAATSCSVSEAAVVLGVSTAGLSKLITAEKALLQQVNDMRALQGLKPLR